MHGRPTSVRLSAVDLSNCFDSPGQGAISLFNNSREITNRILFARPSHDARSNPGADGMPFR